MGQKPIEGSNPSLSANYRFQEASRSLRIVEKPFIPRVFLSHAVSYALVVAQQLDGIFDGIEIRGVRKTPWKTAPSGDDMNPSLPPNLSL